ncbi:MAG: hypothetical protein LBB94_12965 [Clostridiales bacterium]|nr:hypothetical protein [Clostridiales bacterium]
MGKLLVGVIIFSVLSNIGEYAAGFAKLFTAPLALPVIMLLGILYVVLPATMSYALMIAVIGIQLSSNIEVAALTVLFLLCLLFFYMRLAPKESVLILFTLAAFYFKIPYLVPILAGLYCGVTALIPIGIGVFLWDLLPVMKLLMTYKSAGSNIMEIPKTLGELLPAIVNSVVTHQDWIFTAFIFAMVVLAVYGISRINLDYSKDISVGLGALLTVVSFIIARVLANMEANIASVVLYVVISAIIAEIVRFFDIVLDYSRSERVEFEDEDNYYFVKVVPKVLLAKRAHVRRDGRVREEFEE